MIAITEDKNKLIINPSFSRYRIELNKENLVCTMNFRTTRYSIDILLRSYESSPILDYHLP